MNKVDCIQDGIFFSTYEPIGSRIIKAMEKKYNVTITPLKDDISFMGSGSSLYIATRADNAPDNCLKKFLKAIANKPMLLEDLSWE